MNPQELQQKLLEYQTILENAWIGVLLTRDRKVVHCNPRAEEIYGWPPGELIGQPGSVFYRSLDEYAAVGKVAGPVLSAGKTFEQEITMRRKDGSTVQCFLRAKAINPNDTTAGTIWIIEDIGERLVQQEKLHELLVRQQAILDNASVGILFTRNGEIVHCNPRMAAIFGWDPSDLLGRRSDVFFIDPQDMARLGATVGPRLSANELVDIEWLNVRRDGSLVWCRHLAKALPSSDGVHSTIWITEDISEKKAFEKNLADINRELEQRVKERSADLITAHRQQEAVFRSSPLAIYTRNLKNRITSWNPAAERMFGWSESEVLGQLVPTIPPDRKDEAEELGRQISRGEELNQVEVIRQRKDGKLIDISHTVAPLIDSTGKLYGTITIAADITERKVSAQKIEFLAYHDTLTGLPNRMLLQDRLEQALGQAQRSATQVALLFLDLDNFKQVNDTLGHETGDQLLKAVATRLESCVRDTDTISRQGGDEFVIVLRDLPEGQAAMPVVEKIMETMQQPVPTKSHELSVSFSIGVALYPQDATETQDLLKKADMAMYQAKEAGRNTYHFYNVGMSMQANAHLAMRTGLRRAIEKQEFELHYQPQFDLTSGALVGAEALLRWRPYEGEYISPAEFIPVAEDSGLIAPIGEWVIDEVCRQASAWKAIGLPELCIAINLSAVQFRRGLVESVVRKALNKHDLSATAIELELTESIMIQNVEQVLAAVQRLKRLGIKVSIDDFGTGYSSLSYLKRFDIDKLKIDQSFVRDLASDPDDAAIVRAIIQMAHSLNLKTIAEGVETPAILEILREFGCDEAQGYLLGRPMSAADFTTLQEKQLPPP